MELVKSESRAGIGIKRKSEASSKEEKEEDILEENNMANEVQPKNMTSKDAELKSLFYIPQDFSTQVKSTLDFHTYFKHLLHIAILFT